MLLVLIALVMVATIMAITFTMIDSTIENKVVRDHTKAFIVLIAVTLTIAYFS